MAIVAVGICAVAWQQWTAAKRNADELTHRNASLVIGQVDTYIRQFLNPAARYVQHMADQAVSAGWFAPERTVPGEVLANSIAAAPQISSAGILYTSGADVRFERLAAGTKQRTHDRAGNPAYEAMHETLRNATEPLWTPPAFDRDLGDTVVRIWFPVRQGSRYVGAWYAGISLAALSQAASDIGGSFNGTAFVIHGTDDMLAHPNLTSRHPEPTEGKPTVSVSHVGDLVLEAIWERYLKRTAGSDAKTDLMTVTAGMNGHEYIGFFRDFARQGGAPWTVGVWFAASDVNAYRTRMQSAALIGAGIILLALVIALFAGRAIAKPIRRTAAAVSAISTVDIGSLEPLPPSRITEINDFATAFNTMCRTLHVFETYVPRSLVRHLISSGAETVVSTERSLTVMFTDIVGFTTIAEGRSAIEVADLVNEHFSIIGKCVEDHDGTIDKYIGDALMAFWGAPEEMDDTSVRACYCAMAMVDALERDNHRRRGEGLPPIRIRIGIHTGPALVGNIGADGRVNYTIIGDTVNTCQRIENLGREIAGTKTATIIISDAVAKSLPASMPYVHVGSFNVKGRNETVNAYQLMT